MSGSIDESGQLALIDAIVFFLAAMLVSQVLFSLAEGDSGIQQVDGLGADAEGLLHAVLRSSLGVEMTVRTSGDTIRLSQRDTIADCLLLEAHAIAEGDGVDGFEALNGHVKSALHSVVGPFLEPSIRLVDVSDGTAAVLVSLPDEWSEVGTAYAATLGVSEASGGSYIIQLRLVPLSS